MKKQITIGAILAMIASAPALAVLREIAPGERQQAKVKNNPKLAHQIIGTYGVVTGGNQLTLDIQNATCSGPLCAFGYELRFGSNTLLNNIGFALGKNILFFSETLIGGHASYFAILRKNQGVVTTIYHLAADCYVEQPFALCEYGYSDTQVEAGTIYRR